MAELRAWDSGQHVALHDATNANRCRGWKVSSIPTTPRIEKVRTQATSTLSDTAIRRPSNISRYAYCRLENARTWLLAVVGFTRALSRHPHKPSVNKPCKQPKYKQPRTQNRSGLFQTSRTSRLVDGGRVHQVAAGRVSRQQPPASSKTWARSGSPTGPQRVPNRVPNGIPKRTTSVVFETTSTNTYDIKHKVRPPSLQARA